MPVRKTILIVILSVIIITLLVLQTPLLTSARQLAWQILISTVANVFDIGPFNVDNNVLMQLDRLTAENIRLKAEQDDYAIIREQLGSPAFSSHFPVPATVAARPIDTFRTQLILNKGTRDGLILGAPVVVNESVIIGFITELTANTAILRLLLHPDTSLAAEVLHEPNSRGLIIGHSFTSLYLNTIPRDANLAPGQHIVTIAQDSIPAGLLVGTIADIQNEPNEAYQQATIKLPYQPDNLRTVNVLVSP